VIGGQLPLFFGNLASTFQHVQSGRLRALAVTAKTRSPILPDVPTLAESGLNGAEIYEWNVVLAPSGTPDAITEKLAAALQKALEAPEVRARVAQLGGELQKLSTEQTRGFLQQQMNQWAKVIKERNVTVDN
jgi:tripartite-type tricarboxylate transporter receptor subunit TctC